MRDISVSDGPYNLVIIPGSISLLEKLDAAIYKTHASKGKLNKIRAVQKDKMDVVGGERKPWQQIAKETDWSESSCIVANFPPFKDKSRGYGSLVPPQYLLKSCTIVLSSMLMLSAIGSVLRKRTSSFSRNPCLLCEESEKKTRSFLERSDLVKSDPK